MKTWDFDFINQSSVSVLATTEEEARSKVDQALQDVGMTNDPVFGKIDENQTGWTHRYSVEFIWSFDEELGEGTLEICTPSQNDMEIKITHPFQVKHWANLFENLGIGVVICHEDEEF